MADADAPRDGSADEPPDGRTVELLERTFASRAADAPRAVGLAGRARATRRRRLVRRGGTAVLAAAAVGAAIAVPYALSGSETPARTTFAAGLPAIEEAPAGYRWESTRGVEFLVPADWKYAMSGAVPCADGSATPSLQGEVGLLRGFSAGVRCTTELPISQRAPHVWIDFPPAKAQIVDYGGGLVDEGREVAGVIVSVLSDDADLRSEVLDSLHAVDTYDAYGCAPSDAIATEPAERPTDTGGLPSPAAVTAVALCRYQLPSSLDSTFTDGQLEASARLDADQGGDLVAAIEAAPIGVGPNDDPANCLDPLGDEAIVLRVGTADGIHEAYLRFAGCLGNGTDDGTTQRMLTTDVFAALWSAELIRPAYSQMPVAELWQSLSEPPAG